jgi:hypothetical protein
MRRSTGISANLSRFRAGFAGALVLGITLACGDSGGTSTMLAPSQGQGLQNGVNSVEIIVPDSLKAALSAQFASTLLNAPTSISANVLAPSVAPLAMLSACGSGGEFSGYTKSKVPFAPEGAPSIAPSPLYDDGYLEHVPLGFSFSFHGTAHNEVNIYSNGFIMFGPAVKSSTGFYFGDLIPYAANPNNIIALSWSDWSPQKVAGGIRYETRGEAPNRRFLVQFTNVPEFGGSGRLTSQLVLEEGSNDITIYTSTVSLTRSSNRLTQGIENAGGTEALFDSVQNTQTGVWSPRVKGFFKLSNDAVRFSLNSVSDNENPSITAPANITQGNDPGLASAMVAVGSPEASDNCSDVTVSSVRSDGAALDAPYPVGVTTITWKATDAAGNASSATQTVTVLDVEAPVFALGSLASFTVNATSPSGAVVNYSVDVNDNVGVVSVLCEPASGSVFPVGSNPVSCEAKDAAGNSSSHSFSVHVISAHEQLASLLEIVKGLDLPNGTAQPLINQLRTAYREPGSGEATCKKMADFIVLAEKRRSTLGDESADYIIAEATRIMDALGCAEGSAEAGSLARLIF